MTPSEKYVSEICEKSFLPFWSYPNPLGRNEKELCDVLVVCENDIIIISIKDIKVSEHKDEMIQYERWHKKAITKSIDQIYGAERFLNSVDEILLKDRITKIKLPAKEKRKTYRIAIAFGSREEYPFETGDFGSGFIHVFDEESTSTVLNELDTFPDFINYLQAKEKFLQGKRITVPKEVDFLALYIKTSLHFEFTPDVVILDENLWDDYSKSEEYRNWQEEIKLSYIWDEFVTELYRIHIKEKTHPQLGRQDDLESITRIINLEPRINRITLGEEFFESVLQNKKARMIWLTGSDHSYVLMPITEKNWESKEKELELRCFVARKEFPKAKKVIGIAVGSDPHTGKLMFDYGYFNIPELSSEAKRRIEIVRKELNLFTGSKMNKNNKSKY